MLILAAAASVISQDNGHLVERAHNRISDNRARALLAQSLLQKPEGRAEALELLRSIEEMSASSSEPETLGALIDIYASLGRYKQARDLLVRWEAASPQRSQIKSPVEIAALMLLWGDNYGAERLLREETARRPNNLDALMMLASAMAGADRLEEAQALYDRLWRGQPHSPDAAFEKARVLIMRRKFDDAAQIATAVERYAQYQKAATALRAECMRLTGRLDHAKEILNSLSASGSPSARDLIELGRVLSETGERYEARECFERALKIEPLNIEASFYLGRASTANSDDFFGSVLAREHDPARLNAWAGICLSEALRTQALSFYDAALKEDPDYFPAAEGRAFVLAVMGRHGEAIEAYRRLASLFPESDRILRSLARVLAWAQRYNESLELFDELIRRSPADATARREAARAALWAKRFQDAMRRYEEILEPPVDRQLYETLLPHTNQIPKCMTEALEALSRTTNSQSPVDGCVRWLAEAEQCRLPDRIAELTDEFRGRCEIQRAVALERDYKKLQWSHRYALAHESVTRLIELTPGNQEALFDRAQLNCILSLCNLAKQDYERLLRLDPTHSIALEAVELVTWDEHPAVYSKMSYWDENGRDGLVDVKRWSAAASAEASVICRTKLTAEAGRVVESPADIIEDIKSWRISLGIGTALNRFVQFKASISEKYPDSALYDNMISGQAQIWLNASDAARIGIGAERAEELYNRFGFEQGLYSESVWGSIQSHITRSWDADLRIRQIEYSDDNKGYALTLVTGYEITDHPRILKVSLAAERRETKQDTKFIRSPDGDLEDIVHPYWTPDDYVAGSIILEWFHDLSGPHQYCGNRRHFYDIKLSAGTDSESNAGCALETEWEQRLTRRLTWSLRGYAHYSRFWEAMGAWFSIGCRL